MQGIATHHPLKISYGGTRPPGRVVFTGMSCSPDSDQQQERVVFSLGVALHDDLNEALVYLLRGLVSQVLELPKIHWIED